MTGLRVQGLPVYYLSFPVVVGGVEGLPPLGDHGRALRRRPTNVLRRTSNSFACPPRKSRTLESAAGPPGDARITNQEGSTNSVLPPRSPRGLVRSAVRVERGTRSSQNRD